MKYIYEIKGIDCPNCAAKAESAIQSLDGISEASLNFLNLTLTVEAEKEYAILTRDIKKTLKKLEPDAEIIAKNDSCVSDSEQIDNGSHTLKILHLTIGGAIFLAAEILSRFPEISHIFTLTAYIISYLVLGLPTIVSAVKNLIRGKLLAEDFLMTVSTLGAFVIKKYGEAAAVMLFYVIGTLFEEIAGGRSRRSIKALLKIRPDTATALRGGKHITVSPQDVEVGEHIVVRPGEKLALDGIVVSGESSIDTAALTGESVPRPVSVGCEVLSGSVNGGGLLEIRVTRPFDESTASKIIALVENAASHKSKSENFITKFAKIYTPIVVALAVLLTVVPTAITSALGGSFVEAFPEWFSRACVFLVISCPCALVISVPLAYFGGIGAASARGILIKGGAHLDTLASVDTAVFDKTGTLTTGDFAVIDVLPQSDFTADEVLFAAATAEVHSTHPIARSIVSTALTADTPESVTEEAGGGIRAVCREKTVLVGHSDFLRAHGVDAREIYDLQSVVYVSIDEKFAGAITLSDIPKSDAAESLEKLKLLGIKKTVMLTGDRAFAAEKTASALGIDEYHAELLPSEKVDFVSRLSGSAKTVFVGDGINDAPVLARADIGVAVGALSSDAAIEASDCVIMSDELSKLPECVKIARKTRRIATENIIFALAVKSVLLILGAFGIAEMWEAVFGDVGVMIISVLNSMRLVTNLKNHERINKKNKRKMRLLF